MNSRRRTEWPTSYTTVRRLQQPVALASPRVCYIFGMTTAEDIEKAVEQLAPRELAQFRAWFEAFDAEQFDAAIERDARARKSDVTGPHA